MAIAASLNRNPSGGLMAEIFCHDRGSTAQERERACQHALVADWYQLGHAGTIGRGEDGNRIPIGRPAKIGVLFARTLFAQVLTVIVTFGKLTQRCLDHHGSIPQGSCSASAAGNPSFRDFAISLRP